MNTEPLRQKLVLNFIAIMIILPIAILIYERLAQQNNHPSIVDLAISALAEGTGIVKEQKDSSRASIAPNIDNYPNQKAMPKLSIKAAGDKEKGDKEVNGVVKEQKLRSIKNEKLSEKMDSKPEDALSKGNNPDGKLNLPNLSFQGELTEDLVYLMLIEGKAKIISKSSNLGYYEYVLEEGDLEQGRFRGLISIDNLSDRSIELSGYWDVLLGPRYQRVTQDNSPSTFELRFTRSFNQYLAQQQQAQLKALGHLDETIFNISVQNDKTQFMLIEAN